MGIMCWSQGPWNVFAAAFTVMLDLRAAQMYPDLLNVGRRGWCGVPSHQAHQRSVGAQIRSFFFSVPLLSLRLPRMLISGTSFKWLLPFLSLFSLREQHALSEGQTSRYR
ncbi:UNVERIFIED_CONTAM: hypothetical protein K2H54_032343 [Gekko kuhli]